MADSVENAIVPEEEENKDSTEDVAEDMSLQGIFNKALDGDDEDEDAEEEEAKPTAESVNNDAKYNALEEQLSKLRERQAELETENNIYRSGLLRNQDKPAAAPAVEEDEEVDYDDFNKKLAENPAKAIVELLNQVSPKIAKTAEARAVQAATGANQTQLAFKSDQDRAYSDFGDYWEKDKEFTNLANNYYDQITADAPVVSNNGTRYHRGAIYAAMSMAYATLHRQGKLTSKVVPLTERRKPPINPELGSKSEKGSDGDLFSGLSGKEIAAMKRTAEKMGVSWDAYKSRMAKLKSREPGFGGLR